MMACKDDLGRAQQLIDHLQEKLEESREQYRKAEFRADTHLEQNTALQAEKEAYLKEMVGHERTINKLVEEKRELEQLIPPNRQDWPDFLRQATASFKRVKELEEKTASYLVIRAGLEDRIIELEQDKSKLDAALISADKLFSSKVVCEEAADGWQYYWDIPASNKEDTLKEALLAKERGGDG